MTNSLRCVLAAVLTVMSTAWGRAQDAPWPAGAVNLVVPVAAGGPLDSVGRILADALTKSLSRQVVVVNVAGAGGNLGAASVARAKPDGMSWLLTFDTVLTVNPYLYKDMGFNPDRDLVPAASIGESALVLAVNPKNVTAATLAELIAGSRVKPISFASSGVGTPAHLALEYLRMSSGLQGLHVPYRGAAPALQDIVAGAVDAGFIGVAPAISLIRSGALRALAVSSDARAPAIPDVPSAAEAGLVGFDANFKFLLLAPSGVDAGISRDFTRAVEKAIESPDIAELLPEALCRAKIRGGASREPVDRIRARKWAEVASWAGMRERN